MNFYDYKGAIHVHSTYTDGQGSVEEIMDCANEAGLDFVMLTEHNTLKPIDDGCEKWYNSSLLIVGAEITPSHSSKEPSNNHYIIFGNNKFSKDLETLSSKNPQEYIDTVNDENWLGFISHPDHEGTKRFEIPSFKWLDWNVDRFTGMGIWDLMTDWQEKLDMEKLTIEVYTNFANWLSGPEDITLKRWDELNQKHKIIGIGEIDNHKSEKEFDKQKIVVFPYDVAFKTITNHILLKEPLAKDFNKAKKQIIQALQYGQVYVAFDYWDDPTDFSFSIEDEGQFASLGDKFKLNEKAEIIVSLPLEARINIVRNGETILELEGDEAIVEITQPGVYRVEAYRNDLTWILSNPIYVV